MFYFYHVLLSMSNDFVRVLFKKFRNNANFSLHHYKKTPDLPHTGDKKMIFLIKFHPLMMLV